MASDDGSDPGSVWPGPPPSAITAWTIVQAGHVVGRRFWQRLGEVGLSPIQFGVLLQLDRRPGMGNAELARSVLVTPQSMSELLASMVELGLVERDEPRGRGHRITARLTAAGRDALVRCAPAVADVDASLGLTDAQVQRLNAVLSTVIDSAGEHR